MSNRNKSESTEEVLDTRTKIREAKYGSRKERRLARRKRNRRIVAWSLSGVIALSAGGFGAYSLLKPVSPLDAAQMFPEKTHDLKMFTPANLTEMPNEQVLGLLGNYATDSEGNKQEEVPTSEYVDTFFSEITEFNEFKESHEWVGNSFAEGAWEGGGATIYEISSRSDARDFMESPECTESFLKEYCGEDKHVIKSNWLVTGEATSLAIYEEDFELSLADDAAFAIETSNTMTNSLASIWTPAVNITSFLPLGLGQSFPNDAQASVALVPQEKGIGIHGSLFKRDEDHLLFDKKPMADSITRTPENTVMAISVSETHKDVVGMIDNPESFINTQPEWKELRTALEGYGVVVPDDLPKVLGNTTTLSINEGTVGNLVAGTLRINDGDTEKIVEVLDSAAKTTPTITEMYKVKEGSDDLLIESHSPITDGVITDNPLFSKLVGDIDNSIAVAFVDFDNARELLNSEYTKSEDKYDKGVMGVNIMANSGSQVDFRINWDLIK